MRDRTGQGGTVREAELTGAGQLPAKGKAHVPGGRERGEGAPSMMNGRCSSVMVPETREGIRSKHYLVLSSLI